MVINMLKDKGRIFLFVCLCLLVIPIMSGFESPEQSVHAQLADKAGQDMSMTEKNVTSGRRNTLDQGTYLGYIASLSAGESYFDIGKSLSYLEFQFDPEGVLILYEIKDMGNLDTSGTFYFTNVDVKSDILEASYIDETFGHMTIKGTLKNTSFTGKIHCQWKCERASMNFIAVKDDER